MTITIDMGMQMAFILVVNSACIQESRVTFNVTIRPEMNHSGSWNPMNTLGNGPTKNISKIDLGCHTVM